MNTEILLTGNYAAAYAVKASGVQVVSAYPITPQSPVVETISEMVLKGELKSEFVPVESEHSAITVCISASAAGARVFTATSANGLMLMHEQLHWAAGSRVPIVMCCVNRGVSAPWTILNDQQDSISQRDTGWIQLYAEDNQEIYDTVIQAYRIAEQVYIPVMVCYDGFILSHSSMPVKIENTDKVSDFLPPYNPIIKLDSKSPRNVNPVVLADKRPDKKNIMHNGYMEFRNHLASDLINSIEVIEKTNIEFYNSFGRKYCNGLFKNYNVEDAEHFIVTIGSLGSECKESIDILNSKSFKTGLINIKSYRPFPSEQLVNALKNAKTVTVFEKDISYGFDGAVAGDLKSAFYVHSKNSNKPVIQSVVCGLGGRNVSYKDIADTVIKVISGKLDYKKPYWLNSDIL
ncbi:pyruvate ferredoxin oxidoreductase [Candidatus Dependentiae bacterium]|nr:pyruvate ferredoxin oxidoreductase [Candidatus Dependentiae bacterium]